MNLYKITFCWEDDSTEGEVTDTALAFAESYAEAAEKVEKGNYQYLNSISIEYITETDVNPILYIPHTETMTLEDIIDENVY